MIVWAGITWEGCGITGRLWELDLESSVHLKLLNSVRFQ